MLLVGLPDFLSHEARQTGQAMGIEFVGPHGIDGLSAQLLDLANVDGLVIDIRCDAQGTYELIETCAAEAMPCLIALNHHRQDTDSVFVLSERKDDLMQIVLGLFRRDVDVLH